MLVTSVPGVYERRRGKEQIGKNAVETYVEKEPTESGLSNTKKEGMKTIEKRGDGALS